MVDGDGHKFSCSAPSRAPSLHSHCRHCHRGHCLVMCSRKSSWPKLAEKHCNCQDDKDEQWQANHRGSLDIASLFELDNSSVSTKFIYQPREKELQLTSDDEEDGELVCTFFLQCHSQVINFIANWRASPNGLIRTGSNRVLLPSLTRSGFFFWEKDPPVARHLNQESEWASRKWTRQWASQVWSVIGESTILAINHASGHGDYCALPPSRAHKAPLNPNPIPSLTLVTTWHLISLKGNASSSSPLYL